MARDADGLPELTVEESSSPDPLEANANSTMVYPASPEILDAIRREHAMESAVRSRNATSDSAPSEEGAIDVDMSMADSDHPEQSFAPMAMPIIDVHGSRSSPVGNRAERQSFAALGAPPPIPWLLVLGAAMLIVGLVAIIALLVG